MDFNLEIYFKLIETIQNHGYKFQTFEKFIKVPKQKVVLLRHDVDLLPINSLKIAQLEYSFGIKGTYYFRIVPESYNQEIMNEIANLGYEIGYHYEDVDLVKKSFKFGIF